MCISCAFDFSNVTTCTWWFNISYVIGAAANHEIITLRSVTKKKRSPSPNPPQHSVAMRQNIRTPLATCSPPAFILTDDAVDRSKRSYTQYDSQCNEAEIYRIVLTAWPCKHPLHALNAHALRKFFGRLLWNGGCKRFYSLIVINSTR